VGLTVRQTRRLRIPVRLVDGVWECAFGGAVPVNDGAEAVALAGIKKNGVRANF